MSDLRIGQGFDAHRFAEGRRLVLAGVEIPFERGLVGHSDADVAAHAVMDALLGALGEGDLGDHFPPEDPAFQDADSLQLMDRVLELVRARGYRVAQADLTLIGEAPKIKPHREAMRERMARALGLEIKAVSVKATTTEGMGFTGRGEGMAALAVVLLVKKPKINPLPIGKPREREIE